ncbi:hypothetical protein [Arthrobacter pigmenti]
MNQQDPNAPYPAQGTKKRRRVGPSTFIVGAIAVLFIIAGAATGGFGGALVMAGVTALLTAIYVIITGRPSWIRLPGRKAGAMTLAVSLVVTMASAALMPPVEEPVTTASDTGEVQTAPTPTPEPTRTSTPTPTPSPEQKSPEPKPEKTPEQPKDKPPKKDKKDKKDKPKASAGTALAQLATIEIKGRAPKTGYDRDNFGSGWGNPDGNGCDARIICTFPSSMMSTSWQMRV